MRRALAALMPTLLLLSACGGAAAPATAPAAAVAPSQPTSTPVAPPAITQRASVCDAAASEPTGSAATTPAQPGTVDVRLDGSSNTIVVRQGSNATLPEVSAALNRPEALREVAPGQWLLAANLRVDNGATLVIAGPAVRWLKLRSDDDGFATLKALGGTLEIADTCVTSWDAARSAVDENYADGRAFLLARDSARMNIARSELHHLGYNAGEAYGVSWRLDKTTGQLIDSEIAYNFFGMYSWGASDLVITGNEAHHNVLYGFDPHTGSRRLRIENNVAHDNGKHGIILAEECTDSVIRDNIVYNNLHHGIVIFQRSDNNVVEGNTAYGNGGQGINVNDSANTIVRGNTVFDNADGGIGVGQSAKTTQVLSNEIHANRKDGIVLYTDATATQIMENTVHDNERYGIFVKTEGTATIEHNNVFNNAVGLFTDVKQPQQIAQRQNQFHGNHEAQIGAGTQ